MKPAWHRRAVDRMPGWLRRSVLRFEAAIEREVGRFAAALPAGTRVLDAGAGEGQYAEPFAHCKYTAVDLGVGDPQWDYSRLHVRADLERLPFRDRAFGAAVNIVVLEHTKDPKRVTTEMARVLAPGARLLLVVPQEWEVHQAPHDYFRYTRHGVELLLREAGFQPERIDPAGGFFTLLGRRMLESARYCQGGWRWALLPVAAAMAGPVGLALPWLDFLDREKNTTLGYICVARKL